MRGLWNLVVGMFVLDKDCLCEGTARPPKAIVFGQGWLRKGALR